MRKIPFLLLGLGVLFSLHAAADTCQPMFNHQDDLVATNNKCNQGTLKYFPSTTAGSATIIQGGSEPHSCAYTIAVECGGAEIEMKEIAAIDFTVTVPGNKCSPTEWIAVYMFPYNGKTGGDWDKGEREVDFVETTGPNGPGGFASNWDGRAYQVPWINKGGAVRVESGAEQHVTFTSSVNGGKYQWNTYVCAASNTKCDGSSPGVWHAYRETGPDVFGGTMMIVVDDWGGLNDTSSKKGCTLEVSDMVITKTTAELSVQSK